MYSATYSKPSAGVSFGEPWLKTLSYIQASMDPGWSFHMHAHEDTLEISYILGGKGAMCCDGRYYELNAGDVVIKNPTVSHAENSDSCQPIEQLCLIIDGLKVGDGTVNTFPTENLSPIIRAEDSRALLDALFREMIRQTVEIADPNMPYVNALLKMALTAILYRAEHAIAERERLDRGEVMQRVRRYIDRHYAEGISLESIADSFHMSVYYLARQFKRYTGFTPNTYILSCRMGEAQRRLIFTDDSISEIARRCGYENLSYFYASFRKRVGCTPKEYKTMYRNLNDI